MSNKLTIVGSKLIFGIRNQELEQNISGQNNLSFKTKYASVPDLRNCRRSENGECPGFRYYFSSQWSMASLNVRGECKMPRREVSVSHIPVSDLGPDQQLIKFLQFNDVTDILVDLSRISRGRLLLECKLNLKKAKKRIWKTVFFQL